MVGCILSSKWFFIFVSPVKSPLKLHFILYLPHQSYKFFQSLSLPALPHQNHTLYFPITWLCGVDVELPVEGLTFEVLLKAFFCCKAMVYLLTAFRYSLSWKRESAWYTKSWYFWDGENNSLENKERIPPTWVVFEMLENTCLPLVSLLSVQA